MSTAVIYANHQVRKFALAGKQPVQPNVDKALQDMCEAAVRTAMIELHREDLKELEGEVEYAQRQMVENPKQRLFYEGMLHSINASKKAATRKLMALQGQEPGEELY